MLSKGSNGAGLFYDTHPSWNERTARFKTLIAGSSKAQQIIASKNSEKKILASRELPTGSNNKYEPLNSSFHLNDSQKSFNEAVAALDKLDVVKAVKVLKISSEQGYAAAQYKLGTMYERGAGVAKDEKEAVRFYRLAAEQGYTLAKSNLDSMYANGAGGAK